MRTSGPVPRLAALLLLAAIVGGTQVPAGLAQTSSDCALSVANELVGSAAVKLDDDASVKVSGRAPPFSTTKMFLNFLGAHVEIAEAPGGPRRRLVEDDRRRGLRQVGHWPLSGGLEAERNRDHPRAHLQR